MKFLIRKPIPAMVEGNNFAAINKLSVNKSKVFHFLWNTIL